MLQIRSDIHSWTPEPASRIITALDMHTCGEPLRIITGGFPEPEGDSILEKRRFLQSEHDSRRTALMWEPRGHADMYGCVLTDPERSDSEFGALFLHNAGYSTMCGHAIIALAVAFRNSRPRNESKPLKIDTPAGQVTAFIDAANPYQARFLNVPAFVDSMDQTIEVDGLGQVTFDVAFGGAYYAFVDARGVGLHLESTCAAELVNAAGKIKSAITASREIRHPVLEDLGFLYGIIFTGNAQAGDHHSRHVCVFADGEIDRSPTGTGVSARAAILQARNEMGVSDSYVIESILGTTFTVTLAATTRFAGLPAVIPEVSGSAHVTGKNTFFLCESDPLVDGFLLR